MNKTRRRELNALLNDIESVQVELKLILDEEESYYDNMPENLQCSRRGQDSEEAINQIDDAINSLDDAMNSIKRII